MNHHKSPKLIINLTLIVLFLSACGAPNAIPPTATPAPTSTQTARPTSTSTSTAEPTSTLTPTVLPAGVLVQSKVVGGEVNGIAWSPNGQLLAVASSDGVHIYAAETLIEQVFIPTDGVMVSVAWSPDGMSLASAGSGGVFFWDATGKLIDHPVSGDFFWGVAWSPDGKQAASGTPLVVIWEVSGKHLELHGHEETVLGLAWSPNGSRLASSGNDATAIIWDGQSGEMLHRLTLDTVTSVRLFGVSSIAWSPNGTQLAGNGSALLIWDTASGAVLRVLSTREKPGALGEWSPGTGVTWSPDGTQLVSAHSDGRIVVWDATSLEMLGTLQHMSSGLQSNLGLSVEWSPDGTRLASGGRDGTVKLWDITKSSR